MGNILVETQFQALGIHHDELYFFRCGLVEDGEDHGIDPHALAGAGLSGNEQMRHLDQIGNHDFPDDVLAQGDGQPRGGLLEFGGPDHLAQQNLLPIGVGDFDSDCRFSRQSVDAHRLCLEGQTQVVHQVGDAAVLDSGFRLEFVGGDDRAGMNVQNLPVNAELPALLGQLAGTLQQFFLSDVRLPAGGLEQVDGGSREVGLRSPCRPPGSGLLRVGLGSGLAGVLFAGE